MKLSGESLAGANKHGIDFETVAAYCEPIKKLVEDGVQVGADHMGMLATTINALGVADSLEQIGVDVRVQTAISMREVAEPYIRNRAIRHLEKGRVVIFGCGTGNPFFSTDTAAALRAAEIEAEIILKATLVDGVYDKDPNTYPDAVKYDTLSFQEVLEKDLKVMDSTAAAICKDNSIDLMVFSILEPENIYEAVCDTKVGTLVTN